jgi:outer membrane lipoprotein-sorting protein
LRAIIAFLGLCATLGAPLGAAETVQAVLARMDREADGFSQLTARLQRVTYTAILNDTEKESGAIWLKRSGAKIEMRGEIFGDDARSFGVRGSEGQMYYPKMKTVQIYDLGKARSLVDQFLLLGFGSSGKDIQKNYTVKVAGEEVVGGQKTTRLELIPKSKQMQEQITRVEVWIPLNAGHPVQQKFWKPANNYDLVAYSDIKVNPGLPDSAFRLALPADVKPEYPQK